MIERARDVSVREASERQQAYPHRSYLAGWIPKGAQPGGLRRGSGVAEVIQKGAEKAVSDVKDNVKKAGDSVRPAKKDTKKDAGRRLAGLVHRAPETTIDP
ncbi:hypothetical protein [Mycobacterium sp. DL99]|uniref:hypothetical protein n=1 Tax=Mycobacterium sp. DL99 TaxID=2528957 RepID=UPI001436C3B4|nr:hypothetical protein [Mycobacterium sp. DL99]